NSGRGIQRELIEVVAGKVMDSNAPTRKRSANKRKTTPLPRGVSRVNKENPQNASVKTLRPLQRSAMTPPGNWNKAYPIRKLEKPQPSRSLLHPSSFVRTGAATKIFTRST